MIKNYFFSFTFYYLAFIFIWIIPIEKNEDRSDYVQNETDTMGIVLLSLTTTSTSSLWSPSKVVTGGEILEWKASASGMTDQIIQTASAPEFDLSVDRTSQVTITASTLDGAGNLTELRINSLNINSLNLSNNNALTLLSCTDNQLNSLDLQNNLELTDLFCHSNQLNDINVTLNNKLKTLACFSNQISKIDLNNNLLLSNLSISNNLLIELDLTNNDQLIALECDFNKLQNLNIQSGKNTLIQKFNATNNKDLFCIQVDNVQFSEDNWKDIDPWAEFNKDCTFTNEAPIANDDFYEVDENQFLEVNSDDGVLSNDIDPDDDILMAFLKDNVTHGELELFPDGSFSYQPEDGYFGIDNFSYVANDGEFDSNLANVRIEVNMVNLPPIAKDNSYEVLQNDNLIVDAGEGVLSNDEDPDGDMLSAELINNVSEGSLVFSSDGSFTYTPNFDYYGIDSFSYRAFDGFDYSNESLVTINVASFSELIIPNAFTPNNDDLNDTFRPVFSGMAEVDLKVFDTWGRLIYKESGKTLKGWHGMINNKEAENGNYLYQIEATTNDLNVIKREGMFSLIK